MWKLKSNERLSLWREFRKKLDRLSFEQALEEVAEFWSNCPYTPYYLDPDDPKNWPDPWTLIEENYYCDIAKALGMLYTIKFTVHSPLVELRGYVDPLSKSYYNLVWIEDGKYVINMVDGAVLNKTQIEVKLNLKKIYKEQELQLNSY